MSERAPAYLSKLDRVGFGGASSTITRTRAPSGRDSVLFTTITPFCTVPSNSIMPPPRNIAAMDESSPKIILSHSAAAVTSPAAGLRSGFRPRGVGRGTSYLFPAPESRPGRPAPDPIVQGGGKPSPGRPAHAPHPLGPAAFSGAPRATQAGRIGRPER